MSIPLNINKEYDCLYEDTDKIISCSDVPSNFAIIYDFSKRYFNKYGIGPEFIKRIYMMGYINGKKNVI